MGYFQHLPTKKLLKQYCGVQEGNQRNGGRWSAPLASELINHCRLQTEHHEVVVLGKVLEKESSWCNDNPKAAINAYRRLLLAICRDYPICSLLEFSSYQGAEIHSTPLMVAVKSVIQSDLKARDTLRSSFPLLLQLAIECKWPVFPNEIIDMVTILVERARAVTSSIAPPPPSPEPTPDLPQQEHVAFSPSLPIIRDVPSYKADGANASSQNERDEIPCTKHIQSHPGLTPGIFAVFCPHGFCVGFVIMSRSEGPRTFFDFVLQRFTRAPRMIIYDNACNLHRFCLRREAMFFSRTWFLIDRMHQPGHVACHEGYKMGSYPKEQVMVKGMTVPVEGGQLVFPPISLGDLNSQVAEQYNARLDRISTQVAYMSQSNFMAVVKYYLFRCNERIATRFLRMV